MPLGVRETIVDGVRLTAPCVEVTFYFEHAPAQALADLAERALHALDPVLTHFTAGSMTRPAARGKRSDTLWAGLFAKHRIGTVAWMTLQGAGFREGCSAATLKVNYRPLRPAPKTPEETAARIAQNVNLFEVGRACGTLPLSSVRATFPLDHPLAEPRALLAWVKGLKCVEAPCFVSGQAGYALNSDNEQGGVQLRKEMQTAVAATLARHPGLGWEYSGSVTRNLLMYWPGHAEFIPRFKRVNWLTFVRDLALDELCGGRQKIVETIDGRDGVTCHELAGALLIQAGATPEIGDMERGLHVPAYRSVARALSPARLPRHAGLGNIFTDGLAQAWLEALEVT